MGTVRGVKVRAIGFAGSIVLVVSSRKLNYPHNALGQYLVPRSEFRAS